MEIAITSAPSVADIGLSGIRVANRISDDQPVASAIGTSGTSARSTVRRTANSTSPTANSPASSISIRRPDEDSDASACAASTGRPASEALTPGRRVQMRSHVVDHLLLPRQRHQANPERERRLAVIGRDHRLGEVRRHRLQQARDLSRSISELPHELAVAWLPEQNRSGSDSAGHSVALAHPFAST